MGQAGYRARGRAGRRGRGWRPLTTLTRRRWVTIVPRAVLLLVVIGALAALASGWWSSWPRLVLAATAG